jgi:hypothetical protein
LPIHRINNTSDFLKSARRVPSLTSRASNALAGVLTGCVSPFALSTLLSNNVGCGIIFIYKGLFRFRKGIERGSIIGKKST